MAKQRTESARAYEEGGRLDLAEREQQEIGVIEEFLPKQLNEKEMTGTVFIDLRKAFDLILDPNLSSLM